MRSQLLTAVVFLTCSSFLLKGVATHPDYKDNVCFSNQGERVIDFIVHRFSGEKVFLSWHTESESQKVIYEVLRKHEKLSQFVSLGVIQPKSLNDNSADYSFIDLNDYTDSTYYCLKKTNTDSVVFYSITKGVEGVGKER